MKSIALAAVASLALALTVPAVHAAVTGSSISVQIGGMQYTGNAFDLAATDVAGFGAYQSRNFNVFNLGGTPTSNLSESIASRPSGAALLRDVNGTSSASAATFSLTGFSEITITGSPGNTPAGKLYKHPIVVLEGFGSQAGTMSVANVGYSQYSAIVYLTKGARDRDNVSSPAMTINGTTVTNLTINPYGPDDGAPNANPVVYRNAQTAAAGNGNYVLVTGLTAANFTLTLGAPPSGFEGGIAGFTLLNTGAVPEPASLAALAGTGLLALRRRSR